ncbi:transcription repressor NadR [Clostridium sp.]|uniref:transcription repressor NadR n=1 Tax=Clostridium sp. TaxID=1506 RepID=UPI00261E8EF7|nr:transcription repressor NadR [Clostridium sp.]
MRALDRRDEIFRIILNSNKAIKGLELAQIFHVTRQVIVKDIAILRASGKDIIATPEGYIYNKQLNRIKKIIAVNHNENDTVNELETVVKYGGIIEDVIIEHSIYGEIRASLMIKNLHDLNKFIDKFNSNGNKPLSNLTNGVHLHTISADSEEEINLIEEELKNRGFLL